MTQAAFTPRLESAIRVAAHAHRNQTRKGSETPYIVHPFSVMMITGRVTSDEDTLIAALFHDILEDVPEEYSEANMRREFGDRVTEIVLGVTKDDSIADWHSRSRAYLENLRQHAPDESVLVAAADKIHNLMSTLSDHERVGDDIWKIFSTKSSSDQLWWYSQVLDVLVDRKAPAPLTNELRDLVSQLERATGNP